MEMYANARSNCRWGWACWTFAALQLIELGLKPIVIEKRRAAVVVT
jgi:hypothetical protein